MSKYIRYQPAVNRTADENISEDHWLKQFEKNLQKGAVQPRNTQESLFDQINSIMNRKSKYPSVEAAVEDMKSRSGLTAYLDKVKKSEENQSSVKKMASDQDNALDKKIPIVIKKCPAIRNTLEKYISENRGNLPVPAIIDKIKSIHQKDVSDAKDWDEDKLIYLVSNLNLEAKKNNPDTFQEYSNLGVRDSAADSDIDPSNTDAFFALTPAKV